MNDYSSFICNIPKLETIQISFNGWMVKQAVGILHHGTLLSNEKEQTTDPCNNLDEFPENDAK